LEASSDQTTSGNNGANPSEEIGTATLRAARLYIIGIGRLPCRQRRCAPLIDDARLRRPCPWLRIAAFSREACARTGKRPSWRWLIRSNRLNSGDSSDASHMAATALVQAFMTQFLVEVERRGATSNSCRGKGRAPSTARSGGASHGGRTRSARDLAATIDLAVLAILGAAVAPAALLAASRGSGHKASSASTISTAERRLTGRNP
jgi:hypothetical protein